MDLHTLSSSISLGYFTVLICEGERRDKLNMTYALQAQPERANACKNTLEQKERDERMRTKSQGREEK